MLLGVEGLFEGLLGTGLMLMGVWGLGEDGLGVVSRYAHYRI